MKTIYTILLMPLLFTAAFNAAAMGSSDHAEYSRAEQELFDSSITDLFNDKTDPETVKEHFNSLRADYRVAYTDRAGILDSIIDKAAESEMSREEAAFFFRLLRENRLTEYKQQQYQLKAGPMHLELITLLSEQISIGTTGKKPRRPCVRQ